MKLAFFTIAQDEIDLLPLWVAHYQRYAPEADLYVLDHDSAGDAAWYMRELAQNNVTVIPVHHPESFDYDWLTRTVEDFQAFLLRSYETVGFSEVDELLWLAPSASCDTLERFLALTAAPFVRATGYCVVHHYPEEPPLQLDRPILQQRLHWYRSDRYSKVCLARQRVYWHNGFHGAYNVPDTLLPDPALLCLHLHQADFSLTLRRHQRNAGRFWSGRYRLSTEGKHQRLDNPDDLRKYLLCNLDNPLDYATFEDIPEELKAQYQVCLSPA